MLEITLNDKMCQREERETKKEKARLYRRAFSAGDDRRSRSV